MSSDMKDTAKILDEFAEQMREIRATAQEDYYYETHGMADDIDEAYELAAQQIKALIKRETDKAVQESMSVRVLEYLSTIEAVKVMHFLGIIVYQYVMQPTNATNFKTTLHDFNHKDVVLGDMVVSAQLKQQQTRGDDNG